MGILGGIINNHKLLKTNTNMEHHNYVGTLNFLNGASGVSRI